MRAIKTVQDSDIVILLVDATEGVKAGDTHIAGLAVELGKGLIVAVNKWDVNKVKCKMQNAKCKMKEDYNDVEDYEQRVFIAELKEEFSFIPWVPVIFISAQNGTNCYKLLDRIKVIKENRKLKLTNDELKLVPEIARQKQPRLSLIYSFNQLTADTPSFELVVNKPDSWHFSDMRLMENVIRSIEPYEGTPIKVSLKAYSKSQPKVGSSL